MLTADQTVFVFIDVQGRLAELMHEKEALFANLTRLIHGMRLFGVPLVWVEQTPEKLGQTSRVLRELLAPAEPIRKRSFSCWGEPAFVARLQELGRRQALLAGIETHICIHQTAADLRQQGYEVEVVADAVSSRTAGNRQIGLDRIRECGARLTSVEMAFFELMRQADHPAFLDILKLVR